MRLKGIGEKTCEAKGFFVFIYSSTYCVFSIIVHIEGCSLQKFSKYISGVDIYIYVCLFGERLRENVSLELKLYFGDRLREN